MTLATHMVTGAVASRFFASHPAEAFVIGWATHYVLDSIIHWDYKLTTYESDKENGLNTKLNFDKNIIVDIAKVLLDAALGFFFVFLAYALGEYGEYRGLEVSGLYILLAGAVGGAFPDFLQFLYAIFKKSIILQTLQKFHHSVHAKGTLNDRPWVGVPIQVAMIIALCCLLFW